MIPQLVVALTLAAAGSIDAEPSAAGSPAAGSPAAGSPAAREQIARVERAVVVGSVDALEQARAELQPQVAGDGAGPEQRYLLAYIDWRLAQLMMAEPKKLEKERLEILQEGQRHLEALLEAEAWLELSAREAEVRALRAQIRPHFFFNVLNSIYSLIETRPREAQQMVDRVAQLMRRTLEAADDESVPLAWELDSVRTYLAIEEVRLGARLEVVYDVDDDLGEVAVPPLLLQPVVENAIKHGIAPSEQGGRIEIGARRDGGHPDGGRVILTVRDTGPGLDGHGPGEDATEDDGRGLGITRRRLAVLYPERHALELRHLEPSGFEAAIRIPYVAFEDDGPCEDHD